MRVFLTGASGYIGGAVLEALRARGHEVVGLVRRAEDTARLSARGATPLVGDMLRPDGWTDAAAASDAIVHTAQLRYGRRIGGRWIREATAADQAALTALLDAAQRGGRNRAFVYTSGVSVFGDHGDAWVDEDVIPTPGAMGAYHLAGERLALGAAKRGVPVVVLRPGLPYAAGGTFASFFLADAARGRFRHVGDGENFFPCEHLDDLASAYALAVERPPAGQVIAVVDDDPPRLKDLGRLLLDQLGGGELSAAPVWLAGLLAGRPLAEMLAESYRVRNGRAKALLGWRPRFATLREGLPAVVEDYRRSGGA